jgi:hypothetical protein
MTVQASEQGDVASKKFMSTKATLATNGLLTIETYSKSRANTEALRGHVAIVVYDRPLAKVPSDPPQPSLTRGEKTIYARGLMQTVMQFG